jgi:hypothetical protein
VGNSLDLKIRESQIRQGLPTEPAAQVIAKTAVVAEPETSEG